MASKRRKSPRILRYSEQFTAGLSSAILEWFLIFLLFFNALFSYLLTKFARSCKLKTPCLLCSRLDHVFGNEKPGFYRDLLCSAHKLELSSLVFCHVHHKLADAHEICDTCLFSFAIEKKPNPEAYRFFVAKLGADHENYADKNYRQDPCNEICCSCCTERWKPKPFVRRLFPKKSIGSDFAKFDLPGSVQHSGSMPFDGLKKRRAYLGNRGIDPLSHVGYSELKITSESESEVPLSDDDDTSSLTRNINILKEESVSQCAQPESRTFVSDASLDASHEVSAPIKLTDQGPKPVTSQLVNHKQLNVTEPYLVKSSASDSAAGYIVEELNQGQCDQKAFPPALSDLITLQDEPSTSNTDKVVIEGSRGNFDVMVSGDLVITSIDEREVCTSKTGLSVIQNSDKDHIVEGSGETSDGPRTDEVGQMYSSGSGNTSQSDSLVTILSDPGVKRDQAVNNSGPSLFNLQGMGEAYKLPVGNRGGQASSSFSEKHTAKDPAKVIEDLRVLIPKRPSSRGSDLSGSDMSPRVRGLHEELRIPDGSCSIDLDTFQKRLLIEGNESGFDTIDGSVVTEIEGETELDRMKRQFEYDRKCMSDLYKELDEERNASAIAANQAMSMITRLQEEKAALHMEALQYLRMMEEQAEYDVEALQKANDLLAEREKEIQDLESDLDYYRIKYPEEEEEAPEPCDDKVPNSSLEYLNVSCSENDTNGACSILSTKKSEDSDAPERNDAGPSIYHTSITKGSLLNLEEERVYILQCLQKMEKKLKLQSSGIHIDMCNGVYTGKEDGASDIEQDQDNVVLHGRVQREEYRSSVQNDSNLSIAESPAEDRSNTSSGEPQFVGLRKHHFDGLDASVASTTDDIISLESEILDLNERLETLEADRDFLEHAINSLQNGSEGVRFIQEIAHHLCELRNMGIKRREKGVA